MAIQDLSEHALLITLPKEPHLSNDLEVAARLHNSKADHHVIVDFSSVQIMPSVTICSLMTLQRLLHAKGRQLILCGVPLKIAGIFKRVGLYDLFTFVGDVSAGKQLLGCDAYSQND